MRKTGRTKALLAMFLAAASLQAGTAFGAQAAIGSQLQAGTWVKEDAGWKYNIADQIHVPLHKNSEDLPAVVRCISSFNGVRLVF